MTSANWKQLTGFVKYDGSTTVQDKLSSADNLVVPVGTSSSRTGIPATAPVESSQVTLPDDDFDISHDSHKSVQFLRETLPSSHMMKSLLHLPVQAAGAEQGR